MNLKSDIYLIIKTIVVLIKKYNQNYVNNTHCQLASIY